MSFTYSRYVRAGSKLGLIGPQMGQIWDFLRSVSVNFGLKLILKRNRFIPFGANLTQFGAHPYIAKLTLRLVAVCLELFV